jgi:complex iron-sulfur molybdoenzyme family reductase subunit gamma
MTVRAPAALLAALLLAPAARAGQDPLAADTVEVGDVPGPIPTDPAAPLWDGLPAHAVTVAPQRAVRLNDRQANAELAAAAPRPVAVRAATDGRDLAVVLDWIDETEDRSRSDATDAFGDGAALEIPLRFGAGLRLPYVGMGDDEMPVALYFQRAAAEGTVGREAVAAGFGSLTRADLGGARMALRRDVARKAWRALFVRSLAAGRHDLRRGLVPFAIAVWDGARRERGGNKSLSAWKLLRLPRFPLEADYAAEMSRELAPGEPGDLARGKLLVETICAACHAVGDRRIAPPGVAPDLTGIGAIATPGYLRDSLVDPGAVIVPSPNLYQHQDRSRPAGATGTYPPDETFVWHRRDASGKRISKMPAFGSLPGPDVAAIVGYLMTLGVEPPAAGRKP